MEFALALLGISALVELGCYLLPRFVLLRTGAVLSSAITVAASAYLLTVEFNWWTALLIISSGYRLVNMSRVWYARLNEKRLRRDGLRATAWLLGLQLITVVIWFALGRLATLDSFWFVVVSFQVSLALLLGGSTLRHLITTRPPHKLPTLSDKELPTLTVAIPARNETDDLDECLASLVTCDYPKLEILVLDDCSQNKHTPEIIRSFAHAGVRFLQGDVPPDNWLAKNYAYEQLRQASSGELLLFCGVDVRFGTDSLRLLVAALNAKHKDMISVIPRNLRPPMLNMSSTTLVQTMRYAWELALPRRLFSRPPVLSSCWLVRRETLEAAGGFAAVSHTITPESYFAKASAHRDGYSFMQSSPTMNIVSTKSLHEQHSTAVRVEYPRLHRRIELVALLAGAQAVGLVGPYLILLWSLTGLVPSILTMPSLVSVVILTAIYSSIVTLTYRHWLLRSLWVLPIAALVDLILLHESMIRYEFFDVIWKERNVCIPVMSPQAESELVRRVA